MTRQYMFKHKQVLGECEALCVTMIIAKLRAYILVVDFSVLHPTKLVPVSIARRNETCRYPEMRMNFLVTRNKIQLYLGLN